MITEKLETGLK